MATPTHHHAAALPELVLYGVVKSAAAKDIAVPKDVDAGVFENTHDLPGNILVRPRIAQKDLPHLEFWITALRTERTHES